MMQKEHALFTNLPAVEQPQPEKQTQRPAWHRPKLERLYVSLDTSAGGGSSDEGGGRTTAF